MAKIRESDLYEPIVRYLRKKHDCPKKSAWWAGCGWDIAVPAGFGKRKPDVVAVSRREGKILLHLVEGKLLRVPTHGFDETVNQLDSIKRYADYLWAAFPKEEWDQATHHHDHWKKQLRDRGFGLLLVSGAGVSEEIIPAERNSGVDESLRRELLAELKIDAPSQPIRLDSLGPDASRIAATAVARISEAMGGPVRDAVGGKTKESSFTSPDSDATHDFFVFTYEAASFYIQGDPFGIFLKDGRPAIWVWKVVAESGIREEDQIRKKVSVDQPDDVFFFADNDDWDWVCRPLSDLDLEDLKTGGFLKGEFSLGRVIQVSDRSDDAIRENAKKLIAWARKQ